MNQQGELSEAFLSVLNPSGSALIYSTYMGGTGPGGDQAHGIALDAADNVYIAGVTHSRDFPTTPGVFQNTEGDTYTSGFVARFSVPPSGALLQRDFTMSLNPASATTSQGNSATTSITFTRENGFDQGVSLTCTGLPKWAYCSFDNDYITWNSDTTNLATATLTVQTMQETTSFRNIQFPLAPITSLASVFVWFSVRRKNWRRLLALLLGVGLGLALLNGCGGGSGGGSGGSSGGSRQTITATIVAQGQTVQHMASFTIAVN
jgi:hypothetical protein